MITKPQFIIAATSSGSGKTTFSLGCMRALTRRGMRVQPYKCGPDYIDTQFHKLASGEISINLDGFMMSPEHISQVYYRNLCDKDAAIIEGVMGMFDGYDGMKGSSADLSLTLNVPVVLLVNAASTAYSVAPLIYGFKNFNPHVRIAGVVFNRVASPSHFSYVKQACENVGVKCFGYLPKLKDIEIPSRHLGLSIEEMTQYEYIPNKIADEIEKTIDLDLLLKSTESGGDFSSNVINDSLVTSDKTVAVAWDEAFNFTYKENIRRLESLGRIIYFSPIHDTHLPQADFLYLPGGYPEFYLPALSSNESMKADIRNYIENGGMALAECGGMMYLCEGITGMDGNNYPMCNILPYQATMHGMRLHLGYREFTHNQTNWRGHEFHYSKLNVPGDSVVEIFNTKGSKTDTALYKYKNLIAGYTHLYWGENNILNLFDGQDIH